MLKEFKDKASFRNAKSTKAYEGGLVQRVAGLAALSAQQNAAPALTAKASAPTL